MGVVLQLSHGHYNIQHKMRILSITLISLTLMSAAQAQFFQNIFNAANMFNPLDSAAKRDHFMQQVAADGSPYFWAGGRLSGDKRSVRWENGRSEGISKGRHPWSFTGSRGAQPDGQGSEHCLAILNNFYNDGVKFHDVGCSHRKPTVCES